MSGTVVVDELIATIGAKVDEGEFADVFALFDHVANAAMKMANLIRNAVDAGFAAIHETAMRGDDIARLAEQFGVATDAIQELGYAAVLSDGSLDDVTTGLKFLAKSAADAGAGSEEALKAFKGVRLKDAEGKIRPLEDLFMSLSDEFSKMPSGALKVDRAIQLFGRSGQNLIPLLNRGAEGMAALREEARLTGQVLDGPAIAASAAYDDALHRLNGALQGLKNQFSAPLISKVTELFGKLQKALTSKGMSRAVDALANGFGRLVDTLGVVVDVFGWLTANEDVVSGAIFVITAAVMGLAAWAFTLGANFVASAAAAIVSWAAAAAPFLLIGALIALIVDDLYTFIEGGDSLLGRMVSWFNQINPEDNEFMRLLKSAGALLFDLTDTAKWRKLGQAISDYAFAPLRAFLELLKNAMGAIGLDTSKLNFSVNSSLENIAPAVFGPEGGLKQFPGLSDPLNLQGRSMGDAMAEKFPGLADGWNKLQSWNNSAGDFMSGRFNSTGAGNIPMTTVNAPIQINVPAGVTDPLAVGEVVRRVVREEIGSELNNAKGAN